MADSFFNLEDEPLPSFLTNSLDSTGGRVTLGNVTLGSGPGLPVAASTVAKIRAGIENRGNMVEASYLEAGQLSSANIQGSNTEQAKFSLNFKDDLDTADDFIAAHRFSDMLVKIHMDESQSRTQVSMQGSIPAKSVPFHGRPTDLGSDLSTGLLTFAQAHNRDIMDTKPSRATNEEDSTGSDGADSDHFSGSVSSFLANEKLMSVDSVNSDLTDDDVDLNNLPDDELELYFNKLVPPAMQRGRVEGQELPAAGLPVVPHRNSNSSSTEQEKNREQFLDNYDQEEFRMPDVRLAATGMDSCPASDEEDTEDELEAARNNASQPRLLLLPSTSRQLVGESNRPSFRPGLEGGSSDDESFSSQGLVLASGIEHRLSAEGQVINHPVTGDGGGGDGSSGSEDSGSDGGVSTVPLPPPAALTNYDVLRGLGIVGSSGVGEDEDQDLHNLPGLGRNGFSRHTEIGDRVGPVGTGEANSPPEASAAPPRPSPVNWSMTLDRQEALDAMDSTQSGPTAEAVLDSVYLRNCFGHWRPHNSTAPQLQGTQSSFHLSQVLPDSVVGGCDDDDDEEEDDGVDVADGGTSSLGLRGGPCGGGTAIDATDGFVNENNQNLLSTSLEAKYFSQSFHQEKEDSDDGWNHCPDNLEMDLQQGAVATNSVVYQNEEGNWVTDLAYYSSFEKEVDGNLTENAGQFQTEEFVPASNAIGKIIEDQEEFEKEHQFMQEEQIEAAGESLPLGDTSWKVPTSGHLLMRASQVSTEFERGNDSYLRLTLGEFFGQRSEALGCLGSGDEDDGVKRPSFGYIITSPEKREPFPLIRPSEFSSRDCSVLGNTVEISKEDTTLNAEDLDKTLEAPANRTSPKGDPDPQPREQEGLSSPNAPPEDPGSASAHRSCVSPDAASNSLMLSISTITSAIADASISADPSQLATMIMELSKRSKAKNHPGNTPEGTASHPFHQVDHSTLLEALQKSTCAGELSAFDMEKYLRKADVSGGSVNSDASLAHTVFDLTGWASNLSDSQEGFPAEERDASQSGPPGITTNEGRSTKEALSTACAGRRQSASQRRTSIPRPKASCVATPSGSARRPLNSEPSSTANPCSSDRTKPSDAGAPPSRALKDVPVALGTACPQAGAQTSSLAPRKTSPGPQRTSPRPSKGKSALPCLRGSAPAAQGRRDACQPQRATPPPPSQVEKPAAAFYQSPPIPAQHTFGEHHSFSEPSAGEETVCNFRPSTSPLIHSSPSQTSFPSADGTASSPPSDRSALDRRPGCELSPQSTCSSPSLSRLTYISINDSTVLPTPETKKNDHSFALSTTIIRASPTPPVEPGPAPDPNARRPSKSLDSQTLSHQSKSLDALPPHACRSPERSGSALSCGRSQSECNFHRGGGNAEVHLPPGCGHHRRCSETGVPPLTKVDSGYASNPNVQLPGGTQPWGASTQACPSGGLVMPPTYPSEELRYVPMASFKAGQPQHAGLQSLLGGPTLFSSQLAQQYLGRDAPLHPGAYHMGGVANGLYSLSSAADPAAMHLLQGSAGPAGYHQLHRPHHSQVELGLMGKVFGQQHSLESWAADGLDELRGQVVVPEELRFPHACCVGIASQTSLSLFNPSKRWQQVSITVSSLAIDGAKVDSLPYQWLLVKNKTIIGPKSTEEQKVLLIPPQAGVYQCVLSVSSWPASAESDGAAARADVFAKRAVLTAVAENPLLEIEVGKSGCLDFGDVSEGGSKSFPLKILNRTHATVPIRLVISANASAWRCFSFSKSPVVVPAEESLQAGHMTQMSSPSIMNHVLHASYGENAESFMVWVHFRAPQKYTPMGELGPADEYNARIDVEVDCPGPSHVIRCIPVKARVGTARVHAPKDLQTISLSAPFGKSSQQDLPLKNAGNIDVQLKLKSKEADDCFSVKPDELHLRVGEERSVELSFTAQGSRKCRESLLTILVLPSGPQYEVALRGDVIPESHHGKPSSNAAAGGGCGGDDVPPILSNKQFVAWGGVTLGRAVQQKLVLRNNSPDSSHQLRLLIRGQDQDCFQLQSMFSPEERLTRHGELSIRPGEDVAVHLLFAPTRVACMLAKLEIKQSGVRPSQPGVKFTIPLSGYGGTSNIILEDQRKQADGYVATLTGVSAGRVNKVCLCVRNTGSRAAFIKAAAYSDMQTRQLMEASVISLSPSQFVLKERTQEVITVLMKSTQREQSLCEAAAPALLATVCLFCGDEVSRQQYRRLLQSKPEAGRKVLSENSLLKNIGFNERFLGEGQMAEICDLPQRPNEAQLFYGNMSKVVLSLLGTTDASESREVDQGGSGEADRGHAGRAAETDSVFANGNVSLDVLPVKGPQGPALRVSEPPSKASETSDRQQATWSVQPEQLVLSAPTMNCSATTRHARIRNNTTRELSFELSWPAHCLTITPQHGVIEPQCHLQILISPNPSLAAKASMLPWSGQIYVQCDGAQKFIKVQIRRDLDLDVSAAPAEKSLAALSPQAATPVPPVVRPHSQASQPPATPQSPQALLEIASKTVVFPATPSGESSESKLEVENGEEEVRWYLSSFAPPYVKGVDNSGDVYRATYTAFRCSRVSGTLGVQEKMQVPITFLPRDRGDYAQFWDLECHPVSDPQQKTRIRFQLCGTGVKSGPVERPHEGDCSLVKTETSVKTRKKAEAAPVKTGPEEAPRRGLYSPQDLYTFPDTRLGESGTLKVNIRNNSSDTHELNFVSPREPFHVKHSKYSLRSQHYLKLPVQFKPCVAGRHAGVLLVQSETGGGLIIQLTGEALP